MRVDGFDGLELAAIEDYRRERLEQADRLRLAIVRTKELGDALTGDMLARNRHVIETVCPRNPSPSYDELFLTFLDSPEWIGQTDHELRQLRDDLLAAGGAKHLYIHFLDQLARDPIGRLFELSVYSILRRRFPTVPFPRLQGGKKLADMQLTIDAQPVAIEVTVLGESVADRSERLEMQALGRSHWVGSKDIDAEPRRLLRKLVGELRQTSPIMPNVIMAAIHMPGTVSSFYEGRSAISSLACQLRRRR